MSDLKPRLLPALVLATACSLPAGHLHAESAAPAFGDLVTCAVYFRMVVGSMSPRYGRDLGPLAEIEKEKMNEAMKRAREQAVADYGQEMAEEIFQDQWRLNLARMTDTINRNYENVSKLKYQYDDRCERAVLPR